MDRLHSQRLEQALQAARADYLELAESLPGVVFRYLLRPDGQDAILEMSNRSPELLELEPALIERDAGLVWALVDPDDRAALRASILRSAQTLQAWQHEFRITTPSGRRRWLQGAGRPQRQPDGAVLWHNLLLDVSEARQAEAALRDSDRRFRDLLDGLERISVQGYDAQLRVIYWNSASEQLYGWSRAEALGRRLEDLIIPAAMRELVIAATREWLDSGVVSTPAEQLVLQHKNGSAVHVFSSHTMQRNSRGEAELYCVDIDLAAHREAETQRLRLEERLREAQKLEAVGQLAGGIAHDFNNVLGAILANVSLAQDQLPVSHPAMPHLGLIRIGGERARSLVQQILAFSRRQAQSLQLLSLQPLVHETLALLRTGMPAGVRLRLSLAEQPVHVRGDATQLQQVLMNLCTNAWHALQGEAGEVEIGVAALPEGLAHLWVRDSGSGIDEATRLHLFEPFFTTKPQGQGTGLGLPVAHGIVLAHEGRIEVESQPGRGSCFHVYLPLLAAGASQPPAVAAAACAAPDGQGRHIVYVDDDEVMRLTVQSLLLKAGYRVSLCAEPDEVLSLLAAGGVDLVLSDYNMPQGDGLALAAELRRRHPQLPVLLSSGHVTEALQLAARQGLIQGLLHKEKTLEELTPLLQRLLGTRPAAAA